MISRLEIKTQEYEQIDGRKTKGHMELSVDGTLRKKRNRSQTDSRDNNPNFRDRLRKESQ